VLTNQFRAEILTNRVNEIAARVRPSISERNASTLKSWEENVDGLRQRIVARLQSVTAQLAALTRATKFDAKGVAKLDGWKSQIDAGKPECIQTGNILKIKQGGSGAGMASWRTRAVLDAGKYRFEGRVKAIEVLPTNRSDVGVMLRVSGNKVAPQLRGPTDWRSVTYDFEVNFPSDEIELVCELACLAGEAWFDTNSLRLLRLP
jgi:hypothetical protein